MTALSDALGKRYMVVPALAANLATGPRSRLAPVFQGLRACCSCSLTAQIRTVTRDGDP